MTKPDPIEQAGRRADEGIERAAGRADRCTPGWTDRAAEALRDVLHHDLAWLLLDTEFTVEELRDAINGAAIDLEAPPDGRAWGHVTRRAVKLGYIERKPGRYRATASSNGSAKQLYRKGPNA